MECLITGGEVCSWDGASRPVTCGMISSSEFAQWECARSAVFSHVFRAWDDSHAFIKVRHSLLHIWNGGCMVYIHGPRDPRRVQ